MIEAVGVIASLIVISSFLFNDTKKIRIINTIGAALYVLYGILISSFSNVFLNSVLIAIQVYMLLKHK